MEAKLKNTRHVVESDPEKGIMSAADQIEYFKGWMYAIGIDRMVRHEPKCKHGVLMLTSEAFDRYLGGYQFFIGMSIEKGSEFTTLASHAFCHSRVVQFPKIISPELESHED